MKYSSLFFVVLLSACGVTGPKTATMDTTDLYYFRTDCEHKDAQLAFFRNQLANTPFWDQRKKAEINYYIRFMVASCGDSAPRPSGCVVVAEEFDTGHSQATVCRDQRIKGPIINRWETEVDK